ncbi:MAG: hypothetical protein FJ115_03045 [Deltaproteobacteria bacterium]|nr:hypothetical protein [Deltaproteobacteria bacterium]MBM4322512.1 hypothetical protein [Deltaproteobacteria bacterium]
MKVVGILLIIAILFSYVPIVPADDCPDTGHSGNMKLDCGSVFHCPIIYNPAMPEISTLTINGWLKLMPEISKIEELPNFIFHPPKA